MVIRAINWHIHGRTAFGFYGNNILDVMCFDVSAMPTPFQAGDGVGLGDTVHTHNGRQNSGYSDTKIIDSRWIRLVE